MMQKIFNRRFLGSVFCASLLTAAQARAAFIADITQVVDHSASSGFDISVTGSGSLNFTAGRDVISSVDHGFINPSGQTLFVGGPSNQSEEAYGFFSNFVSAGPFGTGSSVNASSGSTSNGVSIYANVDELEVPSGYVFGSPLSDSSLYTDATLATLGVSPGIYRYSWGAGADADSFTIDVASPSSSSVPEPSMAGWGMVAVGTALLLRRRRELA